MSEDYDAANDRKVLYQTDEFEVVSIDWTDQRISALHNHGWSQCLVLVEQGVFENRLDLGAKIEVQVLEPGQVVTTPVGAKHEMRCQTARGKTLHVYTPRIQELNDAGNFHAGDLAGLKDQIALSKPVSLPEIKTILDVFQARSISTSSPYFMNQLFSGVMPQMLMAEDFVARTKTTLATFEASPVHSLIEAEVVEMLGKQIGWPVQMRSGVGVPGGSAANFMAIHCARQKAFPEAKKKGVRGQALQIFVSEDAHYSFKKAAAVLGIGTENLITVPVDKNGRMRAQALDKLLSMSRFEGGVPLMVAATAGTTVRGSFDEIEPIAEVCQKHGVWLHVDGAWGGPALFSKKLRHLVGGIEHADSVTFDAHKLFGASLTTSFFLTKHSGILLEANDVAGADYLFHTEDPAVDRGKLSWQCGRKADATSFWTIWKSLGTEGLGDFVDRLIGIRDESLAWIKMQERLTLVAEPEYLNICVRVRPPAGQSERDWSRTVRERMKDQDQAMVNYATDEEGTFLRLILAHPYLKFDHVRQILQWALAVE